MQKTIFESNDPHHGIFPDTLSREDPRDIPYGDENSGMIILGALTILFGILPFIFWGYDVGMSLDSDRYFVEAMQSEGGEALNSIGQLFLDSETASSMMPELIMLLGLIAIVVVLNLGDAKFRLALTSVRVLRAFSEDQDLN